MIRDGVANAAHHFRQDSLTIFDSNSFYQPLDEDYSRTLVNKLLSIVIELHSSYGYDNFLLFARSEKLCESGGFQSRIIFEQELHSVLHSNIIKDNDDNNTTTDPKTMRNNLSIDAIRVYKKKFLEARALSELMKLIICHTQDIRYEGMTHKDIEQDKILESIHRSFEEILGEGSSRLLFATLKLIYKIDKEGVFPIQICSSIN
jgi:hypothetical protein